MTKKPSFRAILCLFCTVAAVAYAADTSPDRLLQAYQAEAAKQTPGFTASPERGKIFYAQKHGKEWSCASCHTASPAQNGSHAVTGRNISPLAPTVNKDRFISTATVEKWFKRNCGDVLGRACSPAEKADFVAYVMGVSK